MGTQNFSAKPRLLVLALSLVLTHSALSANPQELETARQFANVAIAAEVLKQSVENFSSKIPKNPTDAISKADLDSLEEAIKSADRAATDNPQARNVLRSETETLASVLKAFKETSGEADKRTEATETLKKALVESAGGLELLSAQSKQIAANAANGQGNGPQNPQNPNQNVAENQQGAAGGGAAGGAGGPAASTAGTQNNGGGGSIMTSYVQSFDGKAFTRSGTYALGVASKLTSMEERAVYEKTRAMLTAGFGSVSINSAPVPRPSFLNNISTSESPSENRTANGQALKSDKLVSNAGSKTAGANALKAPTIDTVATGSTKANKVKSEIWDEAVTTSDYYNARNLASVAEPEPKGLGLTRDGKPVSIIGSGHQKK